MPDSPANSTEHSRVDAEPRKEEASAEYDTYVNARKRYQEKKDGTSLQQLHDAFAQLKSKLGKKTDQEVHAWVQEADRQRKPAVG